MAPTAAARQKADDTFDWPDEWRDQAKAPRAETAPGDAVSDWAPYDNGRPR